jgi:ABC-type transport system involved in multi-copper enzyme maturation permease subunit
MVPDVLRKVRPILLISRDVYRAALAERMMYGFLLLAFLFILMANVPFSVNDPKVFEGQPPAVAAVQIGFVAINIFTILITVFVSVSTLQNFLARERLVLLLSKPIRRWQIIIGVILGLFEMVFMSWFLMTAGIWLVILSQTRELALFVWAGMSVTAFLSLLYVSLVVFFYVLIPTAVAGVLTIFVLVAGFGAPLAKELFGASPAPFFVSKSLQLGLMVLPKINDLWGISMVKLKLFHLDVSAAPIFLQTGALILGLNLLSCWKFRRFCRF